MNIEYPMSNAQFPLKKLGIPGLAVAPVATGSSTSVEYVRQIDLFLQNKAKFNIRSQNTEDRIQRTKMCISICLIKNYAQRTPSMSLRILSRISTKTKPKQTQTKPI